MRVDDEITEELISYGLVRVLGQERADRWRPRVPYVIVALLVVVVLTIFGVVMVLL